MAFKLFVLTLCLTALISYAYQDFKSSELKFLNQINDMPSFLETEGDKKTLPGHTHENAINYFREQIEVAKRDGTAELDDGMMYTVEELEAKIKHIEDAVANGEELDW
ncbi:unnamed protein product [Blepharisma stoltei]|uniref:Uncharacterized protein n=1 Tax=Blepharisma stoltei TaxID=1481888 RepID=A0AAU9KAI9_9CILI|nr:unnamed protein product [Blepharisma stoltei]